jgi:hypothetical protein
MWGNKKSLWTEPLEQGVAIRDRIMQHWESFYSASCMNLVVLGGESLDELEQFVTEDFGPVCIFMTFYLAFMLPVASVVLLGSIFNLTDLDCMVVSMMHVDGQH